MSSRARESASDLPSPDMRSSRDDPSIVDVLGMLGPHWKTLAFAALAVVGVSAADLLQPWPLKIVLDNVISGKRLPPWLESSMLAMFGEDRRAILMFAVTAVMGSLWWIPSVHTRKAT